MEMKRTKENWKVIIRLRKNAYENAKGRDCIRADRHRKALEKLEEKYGHLVQPSVFFLFTPRHALCYRIVEEHFHDTLIPQNESVFTYCKRFYIVL